MIEILNILYIIAIGFALLCLILYIPRVIYWFEPFKKHTAPKNNKFNKIALVIPAKNESKCIWKLFESINKQSYNTNHFECFIIIDNENDPTVELAKLNLQAKFNFVVVKDQHCKGDALDGCFKQMIKDNKEFDEILIIDADNVMDEKCLEELNNAMVKNTDVIVCNRRILNNETKSKKCNNWVSNCGGLTHTFQNEMGNWYRSEHNIPLTFCGTGLAFKYSLMQKIGGWPFKTIAEDYEFASFCVANGYTSYYAVYSTTYTEESTSIKTDINRRSRWVTGFAQSKKIYKKKIKQRTFKNGKIDFKNIDYLYSITPIVAWLVASIVSSIIAIVGFIISIINKATWGVWLFKLLLPLGLIYVLIALYTLLALIVMRKYNKMSTSNKIGAVLLNPVYSSFYLVAYIKAFTTSKNKGWITTERIDFN